MFFSKWMSFIKDEALITKTVMPGTHNSGTKGMSFLACCQDGSIYEQFLYGVRYFDVRIGIRKNGKVIFRHGIAHGMPLEEGFKDFRRIIEEFPEEFMIINIIPYMNQQVGPIKLSYKVDVEAVNKLIEKYLEPKKYALMCEGEADKITLGDIRKSGKRYILLNPRGMFRYTNTCENVGPWTPEVHGLRAENFSKKILEFIDANPTKSFFWFQTQQTPNFGTEVGMKKWPRGLDETLRPYFPQIIADVASNERWLDRMNAITCDFITYDYMKSAYILDLNLKKGLVKPELVEEYTAAVRPHMK